MEANDTKASETWADIVAEMRGLGNYQQYSGDHARQLADRIEAAVKREAEGMREVMNIEELESVVDAMADEGGDQIDALYDTVTLNKDTYNGFICRLREVVRLAKNEQKKSAPVGNAAAMRKALETVYRIAYTAKNDFDVFAGIEKIRRISEAALASPPRNCERFATWEETLSAFREETGNRKPLELWLKSEIQAFAIWLFAPATERKGGVDDSNG